ncbi:MAG TPA: gamma-carboxygeranoyl-CoA hydratase, partial [Porticoccus sp.]|nr:gamma-carboxygeranoyl-CoA hydratase [Porticoccus sp.]
AERFTADTALRLGLISEVVTAAELDNTLNNMINALLGNGPKAITAAKQLIATIKHQAIDQRLINETSQLIASIRSSAEGKEGLNAFLEKRAANWAPEQL